MQQSTVASAAPSHPTGAPGAPAPQRGHAPRMSSAGWSLGPGAPPPSGERRRRAVGWRSLDILRATALVLGVWLVAKLLWLASPLLLTAFLGVLFGLAVESGVDRLARLRVPRGVAAALIVFSFYALLAGLGAWMAPTLREQGAELKNRLPEAVDKVESWLNERRSGLFGFILGGTEVAARQDTVVGGAAGRAAGGAPAGAAAPGGQPAGGVAAAGQGAPPARPPADTAAAALPGGGESPTATLSQRLGSQVSGVSRYLFPFLTSTIAVFGGLLFITFLTIYIAAEPDTYHQGLMHLFPHRARRRAGEVLSAIAAVLRRWLVTQLIAMLTIGTVTTIVLLLLGVKAAFALGVIAGLLEFIPTIGPLLSAVPAIAMGFLDSPEKALYVAIAYGGIQFLENHILIPLLMKGGVDLPPAITIIGQALMAIVFGFLGLMVAVPLLAALMVPIKLLYVEDVVGDDVSVFEDGSDDG
jgi:predicted PurR-regulated permease PerM